MPLDNNMLSREDARQWFNDCIVHTKENKLCYVTGIYDSTDLPASVVKSAPEGTNHYAALRDGSNVEAIVPISDIKPYWSHERMLNCPEGFAMYLHRRSDRQWSRSLRRTNAQVAPLPAESIIVRVGGLEIAGRYGRINSKTIPLLEDIVYPTYLEALKGIVDGQRISTAFNTNFALVVLPHSQEVFVQYKRRIIGTATESGVVLDPVVYFLADELAQFVPSVEVI